MSERIGLFYGSSTCYTEMAGEKIAAKLNQVLGAEVVDLHNVAEPVLEAMADYRCLILGIPTWDYGELQEDWENCWDDLQQLDFTGQQVAVYGLGDQVGYPQWFQDALGYLWALVKQRGATMVGAWPNQGYGFEQSQALSEDHSHFVGLSLDDENQFDLSDHYIDKWCRQLVDEFSL